MGKSGSGKSSVLRRICKKLGGYFLSEIDVPEDYLINIVGKDVEEAISILSSVGLGQGHLFLSKYNELSDGQKFRLKLALMLSKGEKIVYVDEFGSSLDVTTGKNLAITLANISEEISYTRLYVAIILRLRRRCRRIKS